MLTEELDLAKKTVNTNNVRVTIGEIANMYSQKELNISPDFQRLYRWNTEKKSSFIESILIGIPIPPIFVFETDEGIWELVDGLQRVSTILQFMGVLEDPEKPGYTKRSVLVGTEYLPSLEGIAWDAQTSEEKTLEKKTQLLFRRAWLDFQILKHPSDSRTKYDLFQRLNRGGEYANEQEVRTCLMAFADKDFTQKLKDIASHQKVQSLFGVTESQRKNQRDLEYIVRLIVHTFVEYSLKMDIEEYFSRGILNVVETERQGEAIKMVVWVVKTLQRVGGRDALLPNKDQVDGSGGARRFTHRTLETIVVGIAKNRDALTVLSGMDNFIKKRITTFWENQPKWKNKLVSAGMTGSTRIRRTIPFGKKWFDPNVQNN